MKSNSTRVKAFLAVRKRVKKVVMLSGTPVGNSVEGLFWQYKCLDGGADIWHQDRKVPRRVHAEYRLEFS